MWIIQKSRNVYTGRMEIWKKKKQNQIFQTCVFRGYTPKNPAVSFKMLFGKIIRPVFVNIRTKEKNIFGTFLWFLNDPDFLLNIRLSQFRAHVKVTNQLTN